MTDGWAIATAIGTIAAAVVPAALFLFERADRKKAQSALEAELARQADRERARAREEVNIEVRRVAVWNESGTNGSTVTIHVLNGSKDPIYKVNAGTQSMHRYDTRTRELRKDPSGERISMHFESWDVLMPGERVTCVTGQAAPMPVWVDFNDAREREWRRYGNGKVEGRYERLSDYFE